MLSLGNECMCTESRVNKGTRRGSCTELNRICVLMQQMEFHAHTDEPLANKFLHFEWKNKHLCNLKMLLTSHHSIWVFHTIVKKKTTFLFVPFAPILSSLTLLNEQNPPANYFLWLASACWTWGSPVMLRNFVYHRKWQFLCLPLSVASSVSLKARPLYAPVGMCLICGGSCSCQLPVLWRGMQPSK